MPRNLRQFYPLSVAVTNRRGRSLLVFFQTIALLLIAQLPLGCSRQTESGDAATADTGLLEPMEYSRDRLSAAVQSADWSLARRLAKAALIKDPEDPDVLTYAAVAEAELGNPVEAARLMVTAAEVSNYDLDTGRVFGAVQALLDVGRVFEAIELLERVLQTHPDAHEYRRMLVGFLGEVQLTDNFDRHLQVLIRHGQFDPHLLLATTETNQRRFSLATVAEMRKRNPGDYRLRFPLAYDHLGNGHWQRAETILREIIERHPEFVPAHALLGRTLALSRRADQLRDWLHDTPQGADAYCGYWLALAAVAEIQGPPTAELRALSEAARRAPNDLGVWTKLAVSMEQLGQDPSSPQVEQQVLDAIERRAKDLLRLREIFTEFANREHRTQPAAVAIAQQLVNLGRNWEARAWLLYASTLAADASPDLQRLLEQTAVNLEQDPRWQCLDGHPELQYDMTRFPVPATRSPGRDDSNHFRSGSKLALLHSPRQMRMVDEAHPRGLRYYGAVGAGIEGPLVPIYRVLGCGGGVIDLDLDGWHDLILTAAGGSIRCLDNQPGAVFRNLGGQYRRIDSDARFADHGFGQGVAIGDYNDDGFQDVLTLNLGRNRLYRNNGDGTFQDVSSILPSGIATAGDWSVSGAFCDIDGDGFNDVVIVNYCDADEAIDQRCFSPEGREINCYPTRFRGGRDQFLRGLGDGRFTDAGEDWTDQSVRGRGLGLVAGQLDGKRKGIFIANDASPNHYYQWRDEPHQKPLTEISVASGLALDGQSRSQGSMGIASADFDCDGDLDLYVTGFANEHNIFYQQTGTGVWRDRTACLDLVGPTFNTVGFGTVALDLDNDGVSELAVTNGHVGDFGAGSPPYAQSFQLFHASRFGWNSVKDFNSWGRYFVSPHVGRAMFACDADADGRTDLVVTHATEPVALLMNHSSREHSRITLHLVDTKDARDAVGAVVEFEVDVNSESVSRRLFRLAGSGYLCSERVELSVGTGSASKVRNVRVRWPDQYQQFVGDLQTNAEYLIVRGEQHAYRRRSYQGESP